MLSQTTEPTPTDASPAEPAPLAAARALFTLILGRVPEPGLDLRSRAALPYEAQMRALLGSDEFQSAVLAPASCGEPTAHASLGPRPDPALLAALDVFDEPSAAILAQPHRSWGAFLAAALSPGGPWGGFANGDAALAERAARARCLLAAAPQTGCVTAVRIDGADAIEVDLILFAAPPDGLRMRVLDTAGKEFGAVPIASASGDEATVARMSASAPLPAEARSVVAGETGKTGLRLELAHGVNGVAHAIGPPLTFGAAFDMRERERRLREIETSFLGESRLAAARQIEALLAAAPFASDAIEIAFDDAMALGDVARAQGVAAMGADEARSTARLRLRLARSQGDRELAAAAVAAIDAPSVLDQALAWRAEPPVQATVDALLQGAPTSRRFKGTARTLGLDLDDVSAAMASLSAACAPAEIIAKLLASLDRATRRRALDGLQRIAPALLMPTLSHLEPALAEVAFTQALGAGRVALDQGRFASAAAWAWRALAETEARHAEAGAAARVQVAYLLRAVPDARCRAAASDLLHAPDPAVSAAAAAERAAIVAELEGELRDDDPLRAPERLIATRRRFRMASGRAFMSAPGDRAARLGLARSLCLDGRDDDAIDILTALSDEAPSDAAAARLLALAAERAGRPAAALAAAERALASGRDDRMALTKVRALRTLERTAEAIAFLDAAASRLGRDLQAERARNHFFIGDFERAAETAAALARTHPGHRGVTSIAAAAAIEMGDWTAAARRLDEAPDPVLADGRPLGRTTYLVEDRLFRYAVAAGRGEAAAQLDHLNALFGLFGGQEITRDGDERSAPRKARGGETSTPERTPAGFSLDRLRPTGRYAGGAPQVGPELVKRGPLVSVVMSAFNAGLYVDTSIRSILEQSYEPIELIVVDDASEDSTPERLLAWERADPRVRVILKSRNDGAYVSKNIGLLQAKGTYVALQDADDWSHPDRVAKSVAALDARPELVGVTTDWFRMTTDGRVVIKAGGEISHICCISFVFRRREALRAAGFFDSVRIEADMEYIRRLGRILGGQSVARLRWPLLIGRAHSASLTASEEDGVARTGFTAPRLAYQSSYRAWHRRIAAGDSDGRMPFPLGDRRFDAPHSMLPHGR